MIGTYLALMMVLLVSRIPVIERVLGQDGLLRWHRRLAPWPISLLVAHAVFITVGYAQAARSGLWHEAGVLLTRYPYVLIATIGLGIMCLIGVISIRAIRGRLQPGDLVAGSPLHVPGPGPVVRACHRARAVLRRAPPDPGGVVTGLGRHGGPGAGLPLRPAGRAQPAPPPGGGRGAAGGPGRGVGHLLGAAAGSSCRWPAGSSCCWRFLTRGSWWQAHPYSLSALPQPPYLRLTVKAVGDHSASLASLRPGTPVMVEGPYGAFTRHAQVRPGAVLVAAGIGVTALRSLLEDLPRNSAPVVLLRASRPADLVLGQEVSDLVRHRRGQLHALVGGREQAGIDERSLRQLVPDLHRRDVYVCGPEGFVAGIVDLVKRLGVPDEAIHHEAFAL